jgi:hypothetical protein
VGIAEALPGVLAPGFAEGPDDQGDAEHDEDEDGPACHDDLDEVGDVHLVVSR